MLDEASAKQLLALARHAIARCLGLPYSPPPAPSHPTVTERLPVFVTLTKAGRLRGCVGQTDPALPLGETVAACAVAAATADPRFHPLDQNELAYVAIEISLLSPPILLADPREVRVGTHGVMVSQGGRRGLLLPQVGAEHGWPAETLLAQACLKAGLPEDAWRNGAHVEIFTAQVLSEA